MKDLTSLKYCNYKYVNELIELAGKIKTNPKKFEGKLKNKTMLMIFEKPSLRTRVSFEVAMTQLSGHAIYLDVNDSPLGKKESIEDTARASSRYVDIIMARVFEHEKIEKLAKYSKVPVINGLSDLYHPCQILSDIFTIKEKKGTFKGLKLCFMGDGNNNITHSLLLGCSMMGIGISIGCPDQFKPKMSIVSRSKNISKKTGSKVEIIKNPKEAIKDADIVYADSWMSYHIPKDQFKERIKIFSPYQVNSKIMSLAKKDAVFMNCLPAMRGQEQTAEVIDGKQSIVFDQAENRLHMQKAIILNLLNSV
jgi:ornithine carbamoyltransferase